MIKKILSFARHHSAGNENWASRSSARHGAVSPENARALATGAALAVSLDTSPAVLVSIYDYAHHLRDRERGRLAS